MDADGDLNNSNASEKLEAMQSELHCGICHDYFVQAFTLSCSHSFCFNCISAWRTNHTDCPVCRRETVGMAPSRALDNMVAALNGGANNANSSANGSPRVDAWFSMPQTNNQLPQHNVLNQPEPETDHSYNGDSDEGTIYDSEEEEELEEEDGDYENDYYDEEEDGYEDEMEEEQEEGEEEGGYEEEDSSYSDSDYDEEDEYDDDVDYHEHVKRSNQNNPNNDEYWRLRGWPQRPPHWKELIQRK